MSNQFSRPSTNPALPECVLGFTAPNKQMKQCANRFAQDLKLESVLAIIHDPFSSSLARKYTFFKFQDYLEISFMDTNGIIQAMGWLRLVRSLK